MYLMLFFLVQPVQDMLIKKQNNTERGVNQRASVYQN